MAYAFFWGRFPWPLKKVKEERIPRLQRGHAWLVSDTIQRNSYARSKGTNVGYKKKKPGESFK